MPILDLFGMVFKWHDVDFPPLPKVRGGSQLAVQNAFKKWTMPIRNRTSALSLAIELSLIFNPNGSYTEYEKGSNGMILG